VLRAHVTYTFSVCFTDHHHWHPLPLAGTNSLGPRHRLPAQAAFQVIVLLRSGVLLSDVSMKLGPSERALHMCWMLLEIPHAMVWAIICTMFKSVRCICAEYCWNYLMLWCEPSYTQCRRWQRVHALCWFLSTWRHVFNSANVRKFILSISLLQLLCKMKGSYQIKCILVAS